MNQMLTRYTAGQTLTEIAADYGCTLQTVSRLIKSLDPTVLRGQGRWSRHTPEQKAKMLARYVAGETAREIAADHGCAIQTVTRALKELNSNVIRESGQRSQYTPDQMQDMVRRYKAGEGLNALARDYGCTAGNVRFILLRRGVTMRPLGKPPMSDEKLNLIHDRRLAGASFREIGDELGIQAHTVQAVCRTRLGLAPDPAERGAAHHAWKGGRHIHDGYAMIHIDDDDPLRCMASTNGYAPEHRIVMARALGRPLTSYETVHHKNNRDKTNNALDNLQLRIGNHGNGAAMQCMDCGSHNLEFVPLE
jgi:transposase-like protein